MLSDEDSYILLLSLSAHWLRKTYSGHSTSNYLGPFFACFGGYLTVSATLHGEGPLGLRMWWLLKHALSHAGIVTCIHTKTDGDSI